MSALQQLSVQQQDDLDASWFGAWFAIRYQSRIPQDIKDSGFPVLPMVDAGSCCGVRFPRQYQSYARDLFALLSQVCWELGES